MIEVYEHLVLLNIMWASVDWSKESIHIMYTLIFHMDKEMATFFFSKMISHPVISS